MTEPEAVLVALDAGVLTLTLNRPDKLNAFNEAMHRALRAGFERAAEDAAVRAVLLTGQAAGSRPGRTSATGIRARAGRRRNSARRSRPSTTRRCG